jgi:hypothetical protein
MPSGACSRHERLNVDANRDSETLAAPSEHDIVELPHHNLGALPVASQSIPDDSAPRPFERRRERVQPPPCSECGSTKTDIATRTPYVLYVRCSACAFVWSVPKPGREPGRESIAS